MDCGRSPYLHVRDMDFGTWCVRRKSAYLILGSKLVDSYVVMLEGEAWPPSVLISDMAGEDMTGFVLLKVVTHGFTLTVDVLPGYYLWVSTSYDS